MAEQVGTPHGHVEFRRSGRLRERQKKRPFIKGIEDSRASARSQRARVLHWEEHEAGQKVYVTSAQLK